MIAVRVPFRVRCGIIPIASDSDPRDLVRVPLKRLIATQVFVFKRRPRLDPRIFDGSEDGCTSQIGKYPTIVQWRGERFIQDGHHRLSKARWRGRKTALVVLVEARYSGL